LITIDPARSVTGHGVSILARHFDPTAEETVFFPSL
jgi:hypothetical protein